VTEPENGTGDKIRNQIKSLGVHEITVGEAKEKTDRRRLPDWPIPLQELR
jgi:hypothetical protein